jgi:hypothetical protein
VSAPVYQWRQGFYPKADPNKVGREVQRLSVENDGEVAPAVLVSFAQQNPKSESNRLFQWDDEKAAEEYRLEQARLAMRSLIIVNLTVGGNKQEPIRAFVNVSSDGGRAYAPIAVVMRDPEKREEVLARALTELEAWRHRYAALQELATAFVAVDRLLARRQKRRPGRGDSPQADAD